MDESLPRSVAVAQPRSMRLRFIRWNLQYITIVYIFCAVSIGLLFNWSIPLLVIPALILVILLIGGIARPGSQLFYPTITHGGRAKNLVALTFDDGPDPDVTQKVLDVLAKYSARATFFVIGKWLDKYPEMGKRIVEAGHVLGNHSWSHSRLQNFYSARRHAHEIEKCQLLIEKLSGPSQVIYRPPIGLKSCELGQAAYRQNVMLVAWSLHSRDTRMQDPDRIAKRVLDKIRGGDIVLMHDGHDLPGRHRTQCVQAVHLILQGLQARGLQCVTVPELLEL